MNVLVFSSRPYDQQFLEAANKGRHEFHFTEARLEERTASLATDFPAVCCFVSDFAAGRPNEKLLKSDKVVG